MPPPPPPGPIFSLSFFFFCRLQSLMSLYPPCVVLSLSLPLRHSLPQGQRLPRSCFHHNGRNLLWFLTNLLSVVLGLCVRACVCVCVCVCPTSQIQASGSVFERHLSFHTSRAGAVVFSGTRGWILKRWRLPSRRPLIQSVAVRSHSSPLLIPTSYCECFHVLR